MRLATRLRTSSALRVAPFALALPLFYYVDGSGNPPFNAYGYAPTVLSYALAFCYSFAYAVASALGAWEAGSLRQGGIWELAPFRSRTAIAAESLAPVVGLAWLMMLTPAGLALIDAGVWPSPVSLGPLAVGLMVSIGHAVIGFCVGMKVPRTICAPLLAVTVWILVAFSRAVDVPWPRHLSGQQTEPLMFGETFSFAALWPHVAFTGSLALAACVLWMRRRAVALVVAAAVALLGTISAWAAVKDWDFNPKLNTQQVSTRCISGGSGSALSVCMPSVTSAALPNARSETLKVLQDFDAAGVPRHPDFVTDTLADGRFSIPSTDKAWRVPLTEAAEQGNLRFEITLRAIGFTCSRPDPDLRRLSMAWAAHVTGTTDDWEKLRLRIKGPTEHQMQRIYKLPRQTQASWFNRTVLSACQG
ncbi:hypothetical protein ACFYYN_18385 [Streptomyces sp. NPDC001902]